MKIWKRVRENLPKSLLKRDETQPPQDEAPTPEGRPTAHLDWARESLRSLQSFLKRDEAKRPQDEILTPEERPTTHLDLARESLRGLLEDSKVPHGVREALAADYREVESMLEKLEHGHLHIAVFGRVSVGKSALLNALLGEQRFATSPLHGETKFADHAAWREEEVGGIFLIDTPGINEVDGEGRERLAVEVAERSDLVIFVVDGDITESELEALRGLGVQHRPLLLALNKADRYSRQQQQVLRQALIERTSGLIDPPNVLTTSADPAERIYIQVDEQGNEQEVTRRPAPEVAQLRERVWNILEAEGKTLAAINATMFAGKLSDQVAKRITEVKQGLADRVVRSYCITKGVAVAFNPLPVVDLLTVATADTAMILHLSRIYGLEINKREAKDLLRTIGKHMALIMGGVWGVNALSSLLKGSSVGLSTVVTAGAQGAFTYYGTYVIGQVAQRYFAQGKSWGETGPKRVVQKILKDLDQDSMLTQAKSDILAYLGRH